MKIKARYDVAILCLQQELQIHFSGIPDVRVANELNALASKNKGIKLDNGQQEKQRLYYSVTVTPVFDIEEVARTIADYLRQDHELTVRLVFDRCPEKLSIVR